MKKEARIPHTDDWVSMVGDNLACLKVLRGWDNIWLPAIESPIPTVLLLILSTYKQPNKPSDQDATYKHKDHTFFQYSTLKIITFKSERVDDDDDDANTISID